MINKPQKTNLRSQGATLIEVIISVFIFSVGVLAFAGLQSRSIQSTFYNTQHFLCRMVDHLDLKAVIYNNHPGLHPIDNLLIELLQVLGSSLVNSCFFLRSGDSFCQSAECHRRQEDQQSQNSGGKVDRGR